MLTIGIGIGRAQDRVRRGWAGRAWGANPGRGHFLEKPYQQLHSWLFLWKPWKASCQLPPLSTLASWPPIVNTCQLPPLSTLAAGWPPHSLCPHGKEGTQSAVVSIHQLQYPEHHPSIWYWLHSNTLIQSHVLRNRVIYLNKDFIKSVRGGGVAVYEFFS